MQQLKKKPTVFLKHPPHVSFKMCTLKHFLLNMKMIENIYEIHFITLMKQAVVTWLRQDLL